MDLAVVALTFAAIFVVELPDKTFIATLVLSTRYRGLLVWLGVGLAFLLQVLIAVTAGQLATLLPETLVKAVAATIFLIGAVVLVKSAPTAEAEGEGAQEEYAARAADVKTGLRAVGTSFLVLFAAEWGDLSQLLTASLSASYEDPVSVFTGAWLALLTVSGLAVLAGRFLLRRLKLSLVHYVGAGVCVILAAGTLYDLLG